MNAKLLIACVVAGALMAPIVGHAADGDKDRSSPKAFVKDSAITAEIKTKLAGDKLASLVNIKVDTDDKGVVSLGGTARSQQEVDKAVTIARGVKGVVAVNNSIQIKADK